jgi:hypothetical protein
MSSAYTHRSSRAVLNVVGRTSRNRVLGPTLRRLTPPNRRETSTVAGAAPATAAARQADYPLPAAYNVPAQELWKSKDATALQDTLRHAYERELELLICTHDLRDGPQSIFCLFVPTDLKAVTSLRLSISASRTVFRVGRDANNESD